MSDDTYTWLLTAPDPCPACGGRVAPDAAACPACRRSLTEIYRPPQRSTGVSSLALLWGVGAAGALLMAIGTEMQARGLLARQQPAADDGPILRALARLLGARLDAPLEAPPPPAWLSPALVAAALAAGAMAWLCWARRPAALYAGLAGAAALLVAGAAAGVLVPGPAGLAAAVAAAVVAGAAALGYLAVAGELLGERRRVSGVSRAETARDLYQDGRALYDAGWTFAAARAWAQALGRSPGSVSTLYALGLALARLGQPERALRTLGRAAELDPSNRSVREAIEALQRA